MTDAEIKLRSPGFHIPTPTYVAGSSGSLSSWLWKLISYSFWNYLLPSLGMRTVHAQACVCACTHTHSLTLLCQHLIIPKEFPYYILSFTSASITRYCLWDGVPHTTVSSPTFLIDQDTAAPVFPTTTQMEIHYLPQTPMKPLLLISRHSSRLRLPSRASAGTLTPASPAGVLAAGGALALMGSGGGCSIPISV